MNWLKELFDTLNQLSPSSSALVALVLVFGLVLSFALLSATMG